VISNTFARLTSVGCPLADKNSLRQQSYYQASLDRTGVETILPPTINLLAPAEPETVSKRMFRVKLQAVSDTIPISEVQYPRQPKGSFRCFATGRIEEDE
jgi:hypothetical protein